MRSLLARLMNLEDTTRAFSYIGIAAALYSFIPLAVEYSGSKDFPLTVGAGFVVGTVLSGGLIRSTMYSSTSLSYTNIYRRCRSTSVSLVSFLGTILLVAVSGLDFVLFTWSTSYVDTAVSASLFEIWPFTWVLCFVFIDSRLQGPHDKQITSWMTYLLMALGMPAIILVILSSRTTTDIGLDTAVPVAGIILAIAAPIASSLGVYCFLFSDRVIFGTSTDLQWDITPHPNAKPKFVDLSVNLASFVAGRALTIPVVLILAWRETGLSPNLWLSPMLGGLLAGLFLHAPAATIVRRAHTLTSRREIISLQYLSPILAIIWLAITLGIDVYRIDFLIFGTISIVMLNMLINVDPEVPDHSGRSLDHMHPIAKQPRGAPVGTRYRLKALVISLLTFGMFIYFRDELLPEHDFSWDEGGYWSILGVASTVFALLLAFRLTRVEALLLAEDYRTLDLVRRVEMLPNEYFQTSGDPKEAGDSGIRSEEESGYDSSRAHDEGSRENLIHWLRILNRSNKLSQYRFAYNCAHMAIHGILKRVDSRCVELNDESRSVLAHIRSELDALALGRQHAREFAERIALWLIGSMIVALCLAAPPQVSNWARLLSDSFAIILASVVLFLLVHLADVRRSRANELLMDKDPIWPRLPEGLYIRFSAERDITWRRIASGLIILVIVGSIVTLLTWRRLGGL